MDNRKLIYAVIGLGLFVIIIVMVIVGGFLFYKWTASRVAELDPQARAITQLEKKSEVEPDFVFSGGFPVFVSMTLEMPGDNLAEQAQAYIEQYQDLYFQDNPDLEIKIKEVRGETVVFYQTYKGVPVFGAELVVNFFEEQIFDVIGDLVFSVDMEVVPGITPGQAAEIAIGQLGDVSAQLAGQPQLMIFEEALLGNVARNPKLAWQMIVKGESGYNLLVDAHTGEVLLTLPLEYYGGGPLAGFDFDMQDAESEANAFDNNCFYYTNETQVATEDWFNPSYEGFPDAERGQFGGTNIYAFYHSLLGRHSYDNKGSQLEIFIHTNKDGIYWSPYCELIYGSFGWVDMDIIGHEFTHGVIQETSGLVYINQSGAINESFADIMGALADQWTGDDNWTVGEDRAGGPAIRDLSNPAYKQQPGHYDDLLVTNEDFGGVHTNSGIPNYAAYIMTEGGDYWRRGSISLHVSVSGIGRDKMMYLAYATMTTLPKNASFKVLSKHAVEIAKKWSLTPNNAWTEWDVCDIRNAYALVGLAIYDTDCDGVPDNADMDNDGDGVLDQDDNCVNGFNPKQEDKNFNVIGDACEYDGDNDGIPTGGILGDNCPGVYNPSQKDANYNGIGEACDEAEDGDMDNDGWADGDDNCPLIPNSGQENVDKQLDDEGDVCDPDDDEDGISNDNDNCPWTKNFDQANKDGDGAGDACDICDEGDDVKAWTQGFPELGIDPEPIYYDDDEDGIPNACDDDMLFDGKFWQAALDLLSPDGSPHEVSFRGEPEKVLTLPIPPCPPDNDGWYSETWTGFLTFEGLDPNIFVRVVNGGGELMGKSRLENGNMMIPFSLQGGSEYFLQVFFGMDYPDGQVSTADLRMACGELELSEDEPEIALESIPKPQRDQEENSSTMTPTLAEVPTSTSTVTVTEEACTFNALVDIYCREGPDNTFYEIDGFLQGQTAPIIGQSVYGFYWYVVGPNYGNVCTVPTDERYGTVSGFCENLPRFTPMPTPLPTETPTPTPRVTSSP